jgi:CRISPR-associated protein Csm1
MEKERQFIYLAGLLHDIGKFYQRADPHGTSRSVLLHSSTKQQEDLFCPPSRTGTWRTHKHVLWTYQFFVDFSHLFKRFLTDGEWERLATLAASHHLPNANDRLQSILQKADHYASGMDREGDRNHDAEHESEADTNDASWEKFKDVRLRPITESLSNSQSTKSSIYRLGIDHFSLDRDKIMPIKASEVARHGKQEYKALWDKFKDELGKVESESYETFAETLLALLHKYTVAIPASTIDFPDVSLYDHSRSVAALALCLYDWHKEKKPNEAALKIDKGDEPFILFGGQLSGIQSFIYGIIGKNAAKNLKGRSFYLELLNDDTLGYLLSQLGLPSGQIVYNSGGNFYILLPNTEQTAQILSRLQADIQQRMLEKHGTDLTMVFAQVVLCQEGMMGKKINEGWEKLHIELGKAKNRKLSSILTSNYDKLFEVGESGGDQPRDVITGEEIYRHPEYLDEEENQPVSDATFSQIALGHWLKKTDFILETKSKERFFVKEISRYKNETDPIDQLGATFYLLDKEAFQAKSKSFEDLNQSLLKCSALNNLDFLATQFGRADTAYTFKLYGGNDYPTIRIGGDEVPKTFAELAGRKEEDRNYEEEFKEAPYKRLGVLRMDVDNLGETFRDGFAEHERTFARYASLSRQLDTFFKGYLNTLWASSQAYKEYLQIIYSGGDDLFVVGRWDVVIRFAAEVRTHFRLFVCGREDLSISGGVALVPPKFPIAKAAQLAGEAEDQAKAFTSLAGEKKNAFCLFGEPLSWDSEFAQVQSLKDNMVALRENNDLSAGFLQQLMRFQAVMHRHQRNPKYQGKPDLSYKWNCAYAIGRYKERSKDKGQDILNFLERAKIELFTTQRNFDLYAVAARWAELEIRMKPKHKEHEL